MTTFVYISIPNYKCGYKNINNNTLKNESKKCYKIKISN